MTSAARSAAPGAAGAFTDRTAGEPETLLRWSQQLLSVPTCTDPCVREDGVC